MELTKKCLDLIEGNSRIRNLIALDQECSESAVRRWIKENTDDLTKASILKIIREETGLTDAEILTESVPAHKS